MRGSVAKKLRRFAKEDFDWEADVVYTTVTTGQGRKRMFGEPMNESVVLGQCMRQYYKLLKKIWKYSKGTRNAI